MPQITYIQPDGAAQTVVVDEGQSVMEGAVWNHIVGILGVCAGDGGCATCHVHVEEAWIARVGKPLPAEKRTLRFACEASADSRLSCQIAVTQALDGLIVRVPRRQF